MRERLRLEARVLEICDSIQRGARIEDDYVELKSDWPKPERAARRLAAHANAARGEKILWLVGLDEHRGVVRFTTVDPCEWWPQVQSHFCDAIPTLHHQVIHTEDGPVIALSFDTGAGPFLVKNPRYGEEGGGPVECEVPWREGARTRTARRADLMRMLAPVSRLPDVEVLSVTTEAKLRNAVDERLGGQITSDVQRVEHIEWHAHIRLYVSPQGRNQVVIPVHRSTIEILVDCGELIRPDRLAFARPGRHTGNGYSVDSVSVDVTSAEAVIRNPGVLLVNAHAYRPLSELPATPKLTLRLTLGVVGAQRPILLDLSVTSQHQGERERAWAWKDRSA